jgi:hypothetical protein
MVKHIERKCNVQEPLLLLDLLQSYCPLLLFLVQSMTWKILVGIQNNFIQWSSTIGGSAVHKNHNSILTNYRVIALCYFSIAFFVRSINWRLMIGIQYNFIQWSSTLRGSAHGNQLLQLVNAFWNISLLYEGRL